MIDTKADNNHFASVVVIDNEVIPSDTAVYCNGVSDFVVFLL